MSAEKLRGKTNHLDDRALAAALADPGLLSEEARAHLKTCPVCAGEVERFRNRLDNLGRRAREEAPRSVNRFRFAPRENPLLSLFSRPRALAAGGMAVLALATALGLNLLRPAQEPVRVALNAKTEQTTSAGTLEEWVPLTPFHTFVIGQESSSLSDDFVEFVADPLENI